MRVAALHDIHGNPPALEAVLQDLRDSAEQIRRTEYPQAEGFAKDILQPPVEAQMLEIFTQAELRWGAAKKYLNTSLISVH